MKARMIMKARMMMVTRMWVVLVRDSKYARMTNMNTW